MKKSLLHQAFVLALVVAHLVLISCSNNPTEPDQSQQPDLPPANSMTFDTGLFDNSLQKTASSVGLNYTTARITVGLATATILVIMSVPTLTFAAAISQTPEFKEGKWHWNYTVTDGNFSYQADLTGWIDTDSQESVWEMRITTSGFLNSLDGFLWYSGRAKLDISSGYWDIFDPTQPNSSVKVLRIDWQTNGTDQANVKFTGLRDDVAQKVLTYDANASARSMIYEDSSASTVTTVEWDAQTQAGSIIAPSYKNGDKACWDENLDDVACQ